MLIPSKINILSYVEIESDNGIQALINELERIKNDPHKQHIIAVRNCAEHIAKYQVVSRFEKLKGIYYNYVKKMWYAEKMIKGKLRVIKYGVDRNEVILAYKEYLRKNIPTFPTS